MSTVTLQNFSILTTATLEIFRNLFSNTQSSTKRTKFATSKTSLLKKKKKIFMPLFLGNLLDIAYFMYGEIKFDKKY